jgi:hypothetical protein
LRCYSNNNCYSVCCSTVILLPTDILIVPIKTGIKMKTTTTISMGITVRIIIKGE